MATKRQIRNWERALEARQDAVAKERNKLDTFLDEAEMLRDSCERAWDSLQDARDALSELV